MSIFADSLESKAGAGALRSLSICNFCMQIHFDDYREGTFISSVLLWDKSVFLTSTAKTSPFLQTWQFVVCSYARFPFVRCISSIHNVKHCKSSDSQANFAAALGKLVILYRPFSNTVMQRLDMPFTILRAHRRVGNH